MINHKDKTQRISPTARDAILRKKTETLSGKNFDFFLMRYILSQKRTKIYLELIFFNADLIMSAQTIPIKAPKTTSLTQ